MLSKRPILIILSLAIAIFLWAYVIGEVDPQTKAKINNINIKIENQESLVYNGLSVALDGDLTTNARIKGKRSVVTQAKLNGISASVDVTDAKLGENELPISFNLPTGVSIDGSTARTVTINVEERDSKEVPVIVDFTDYNGTESKPYVIDVSPEKMTVKGAKSKIRSVTAVHAVADWNKVSKVPTKMSLRVEAIDSAGNKVPGIDFEMESIIATVQFMKIKSVPVKLNVTGYDKSQFNIASAKLEAQAKLLVPDSKYDEINEVEGKADLSDITTGGVVFVPVEIQLPDGVYLERNFTDNAIITVNLAK